MPTFLHTQFNQKHPGVERVESVVESYRIFSQAFEGSKGLAALLLGALVSSLDGHFKFPHLWPVKFPCQDVRFNYASFNLIREAASFIL